MNNAAATGYAILAAKAVGLDDKTVIALTWAMQNVMDEYTEEEAEEAFKEA